MGFSGFRIGLNLTGTAFIQVSSMVQTGTKTSGFSFLLVCLQLSAAVGLSRIFKCEIKRELWCFRLHVEAPSAWKLVEVLQLED